MKRSTADIVREYGPFPDVGQVGGVSYDGTNIWIAAGDTMKAVDPERGTTVRSLNVPAHAGTAFDGKYLFQISGDRIQKVDPESGRVVSSIPTPDGGASGMAWAEGSLWVGQHRNRKIHQVDPESGKILRTIDSNRFVTGVTWVGKELWHGTWEEEKSDLRRVDPQSGEVLELIEMPQGVSVSGLESNGGDLFFCGGGTSGMVRAVRKPKRQSQTVPAESVPAAPGIRDRDPRSRQISAIGTLSPAHCVSHVMHATPSVSAYWGAAAYPSHWCWRRLPWWPMSANSAMRRYWPNRCWTPAGPLAGHDLPVWSLGPHGRSAPARDIAAVDNPPSARALLNGCSRAHRLRPKGQCPPTMCRP